MTRTQKKKSVRGARIAAKLATRARTPVPKAPARPAAPTVRPTAATPRPEPWHAVSIVSRITTCEAALQRRGQRYLSREAPRLPLPECDRSQGCRCVYRHHADRRAGPRRSSESGGPPVRTAPVHNVRLKRGRRKLDV
jgi:hypothetical protein